MPDNVDALIAQGIKPGPPPDLIGPISSLAQLSYAQANADRARAETGQIQQTTQFTGAKIGALQSYKSLLDSGETPENAIVKSGLSALDPTGADAALKNVQQQREIGAIRGYDPNNPNSLAPGGPGLVSTAAGAQKTQADTAETQLKVKQGAAVLMGQIGNMITTDPSPAGRQRAIAMAHAVAPTLGINADMIDRAANLPDDKWIGLGKELQALGQTAETHLRTSGQEAYNQGVAKAGTAIEKVTPGESLFMGPGAQGAFAGGTVPPMVMSGAPSTARIGLDGKPVGPNPTAVPGAPVPAASAAPIGRSTFTNPTLPIFAQASAGAPGGYSPAGLAKTIQIESKGNPNAVSSTGAAGLGQFIPSTWKQFGIGSPFDPKAAIDATARYSAANAQIMAPLLGRNPTDAELYLAHQQGPQGALKLLANPNTRAGDLVGDKAIRVNGGDPNAPASTFTDMWTGRFNGSPGVSTIPFGGRTAQLPPSVGGPSGPAPGSTVPAALIGPATTGGGFGTPLPAPMGSSTSVPGTPPATTIAAAPSTPAPAPSPATPVPTIADPTAGGAPKTGLAADNAAPLTSVGPSGIRPVVQGMSLAQKAEQEETGKGYGELPQKLASSADAAKTQNLILDEMQNSTDGWRQGKWSGVEQEAREGLQAAAKAFGIDAPGLDKATGNYQGFVKLAGNVLRVAAHETSTRVGVQEMNLIGRSIPGPEMADYGLKTIFSQMKGLNDFNVAKQQAATEWKNVHGTLAAGPQTGGQDFQTFWNNNASPAAFVMHRLWQENPAIYNNMIANMAKTPEGKKAIQNIKDQATWATTNGLF